MSKKNAAEKLLKRVVKGDISLEKAAAKLGVSKKKLKKRVAAFAAGSAPPPKTVPATAPPASGDTLTINSPIIANHLIGERWILPAAKILSHTLAVARRSAEANTFREVTFLRPARVTGVFPLAVDLQDDGAFTFSAGDRAAAKGRISQQRSAGQAPLPALKGVKFNHLDGFYDQFRELGYTYGPDLRLLHAHAVIGGRDVYTLKANREPEPGQALDPFLLDAAFHAVIHTADAAALMRREGVMILPHAVGELTVHRPLQGPLVYCAVSALRRGERNLTVDITLYDPDRRPLVTIRDMAFGLLTRELQSLAEGRAYHHGIHAYLPVWEPRPTGPTGSTPTHVLITADEPCARAVSQQLNATGARVVHLSTGRRFETPAADQIRAPFGRPETWTKLLAHLGDEPQLCFNFLATPGIGGETHADPAAALQALFLCCKALSQSGRRGLRLRAFTHHAFKVLDDDPVSGYAMAGLSGLLQTLRQESAVDAAVIDLDDNQPHAVAQAVLAETAADNDALFARRNGRALTRRFQPCPTPQTAPPPVQTGGVYVMAGGAGAIGRGLSLNLANRVPGLVLVWLGRSPLSVNGREAVAAVRALGSEVHYFQADISDDAAAEAVFQKIFRLGPVRGIFHLVGSDDEGAIAGKPWKAFKAVYDGKVSGAEVMDRLTRDQPMDFFVAFASTIGVTGTPGMSDYAAGNAFLDGFGHYRRRAGAPGHTAILDWTLWYDGGMGLDESVRAKFVKRTGVVHAFDAYPMFDRVMATPHAQIVIAGNDFYFQPKQAEPQKAAAPSRAGVARALTPALSTVISGLLADVLRVGEDELDADTDIRELGADSVAMSDLSLKIEENMDVTFDATLLYEYQTVNQIAHHMAESDPQILAEKLGLSLDDLQAADTEVDATTIEVDAAHEAGVTVDVAVIGMSGRYPRCADVETLWEALLDARDLVTEVPASHWDWRLYYGDPKESEGSRTHSKWGGFLDDLRCFDAAFFRISPREAELMDPQQRMLMEEAWRTIEDAGYRPSALADTNTGVFVGITNDDYSSMLSRDHIKKQIYTATGSYPCIAANRISFFYGFHGPSLSLDTACASSLTAIHQAVVSIRSGMCPTALAGGVNLCFTPRRFMAFSQAGMLAVDGRCKTFDSRANGYVRGEGVGLLLLKQAHQAVADGDHIYAVIKGSSFNHGGLNTTITAPNPTAQADLIVGAMNAAGFDPATITYMESHGTGTSLGDPLEIRGLKKAYQRLYDKWGKPAPAQPHIAVGALKSNIGHLEAAAGIAGITKVLLAMKYRYLPQNLHFIKQNPAIDLDDSPFYLLTQAQPWRAPLDPAGKPLPLRAGLSSFGFGGANAHVVLESVADEYTECLQTRLPLIFPLSARDEAALQKGAERLLDHLQKTRAGRRLPAVNLNDIAFTLQQGREPMEVRLTLLTDNLDQLLDLLTRAARAEFDHPMMRFGRIARKKKPAAYTPRGTTRADLLEAAEHWVAGEILDWTVLPVDTPGRRIPLSTYAFAKEAYWMPEAPASTSAGAAPAALHPLVTTNVSDVHGLRFQTRFTGAEFYLDHHRVAGSKVLPGTAYFELARAAAQLAGYQATSVANLFWPAPVSGDRPDPITITLTPEGEHLTFEIASDPQRVHARGQLSAAPLAPAQRLDLLALPERCRRELDPAAFYRDLTALGLALEGGAFAVIRRMRCGADEVFAELKLDPAPGDPALALHPALLDGALQTSYALFFQNGDHRLQVPFTVENLAVHAPIPHGCLVHTRRTPRRVGGMPALDITIADLTGAPVVVIRGFIPRDFQARARAAAPAHDIHADLFAARPVWAEETNTTRTFAPGPGQVVVLFDDDDTRRGQFTRRMGSQGLVLGSGSDVQAGADGFTLRIGRETDVHAFMQHLQSRHLEPALLIYLPTAEPQPGLPFKNVGEQVFGPLFLFLRAHQAAFGKARLRVTAPFHDDGSLWSAAVAALAGMGRSLARERSNIHLSPRALTQALGADTTWLDAALLELDGDNHDRLLRIEGPTVQRRRLEAFTPKPAQLPLGEGDVVLVTGGSGALARELALHLARRYGASVVLVGRSPLDHRIQDLLDQLAAAGEPGAYEQSDITDPDAVQRLMQTVQLHHGLIRAVFHLAAVHRDNRLAEKSLEEALDVLDPKINGALLLDQATLDMDLKAFVLFSSLVPVLGIAGQTDYAFANAFLDGFAAHRQALVQAGKRSGLTCSINLPHWRAGGMKLEEQTAVWFADTMGLLPMDTAPGLDLMDRLIMSGTPRTAAAYGDRARLAPHLDLVKEPAADPAETAPAASAQAGDLDVSGLMNDVTAMLCKILKVKRIDPARDLGDYGAESVALAELTNKVNKTYGLSITPVVFFEHATLNEFIQFLVDEHGDRLAARLSQSPVAPPTPQVQPPPQAAPAPEAAKPKGPASPAVAVVGMAGIMPGSADLDAFWEHLKAGHDLVTVVPADRYNWRDYDGDPATDANRTGSRWGGFMPDVHSFDYDFFGINPREAQLMDPQQRLLLSLTWSAIEDAGHDPSDLSGSATGVFMGVSSFDYFDLMKNHQLDIEAHTSTGVVHSILANRISWYFNLKGPSFPVDTACSSSLVALHQAVEAMSAGSCDQALVGGVNLLVSPTITISFSKAGMLSPNGRCRTFDAGADGYVRGEGAGVVLLKPLDRALADGNPVHGVIRGSAVNHGGRAQSLTAPNPKAQTALIERVHAQAGFAPDTVTYMEAHGTGTSLGDPIELNAMKKAFANRFNALGRAPGQGPWCGVGSVKTNIGHLEAGAGMAGLFKILYAMRSGFLPASLHVNQQNPYIDLDGSPFYLVTRTRLWPRLSDEGGRPLPRRAGVSSFGFGGANAHVAIEEYMDDRAVGAKPDGPQPVLLSARDPKRLRAYAQRLADFFSAGRVPEDQFAAALHTLQVGRRPMAHRLMVPAENPAHAAELLKVYAASGAVPAGGFVGHVEPDQNPPQTPAHGNALTAARAWVFGAEVDWNRFALTSRRLTLPTYPFAPTRCWLPIPPDAPPEGGVPARRYGAATTPTPTAAPTPAPAPAAGPADFLAGFEPLEHYAAARLIAALLQMGVFQPGCTRYDLDRLTPAWLASGKIRFFNALPALLVQTGLAHQGQRTLILHQDPSTVTPEGLALLKGELTAHPVLQAHIHLLDACLDRLPDLLYGRLSATDVLFPDASDHLVRPIYGGNPHADHLNRLVAQRVAATAPQRVLEVGAGTGGTSTAVLAQLGPNTTYMYTDVSRHFLETARTTFARAAPQLRFETLDLERDPLDQSFEAGAYDVILAANVLHAVHRVDAALQRLTLLLKPGGRLILNELTKPTAFVTLTFGLLDGWWAFDAAEPGRIGGPLLDENAWRAALNRAGFDPVDFHGDAVSNQVFRQQIIEAVFKPRVTPSAPPTTSRAVSMTPPPAPVAHAAPAAAGGDRVEAVVVNCLQTALRKSDPVPMDKPFTDLGIDSIFGVELVGRINKALDLSLRPGVLFDHATPRRLVTHLRNTYGAKLQPAPPTPAPVAAAPRAPAVAPAPVPQAVVAAQPASQPLMTFGGAVGVRLTGPVEPHQIQLEPLIVAKPGRGEVLIHVRAFSINQGDLLCLRGLYPTMPDYPFTPGMEVAGDIAAVGPEVRGFRVGDPVVAVTGAHFGAHANTALADAHLTAKKPANRSYAEAVAFPVGFLLMNRAMTLANVEPSDCVLIQSAAGGVGVIGVQLALARGAELFVTAGDDAKCAYLTQLGAHHVINYRSQDFSARIRQLTDGRGVDVVINTQAGDAMQRGLDLLAPEGRYVEVAMMALRQSGRLDLSGLVDNHAYFSIDLRRRLTADPKRARADFAAMSRALAEGRIRPVVAQTFPFDRLDQAYAWTADRRNIGRVVVTVPPQQQDRRKPDIAVIGLAGRYPTAPDPDTFWSRLEAGQDCVRPIPPQRWSKDQWFDPKPRTPGKTYCAHGGYLDDIDHFDARFFNISGAEAARTDPQQRLFLETAWTALEMSGYSGEKGLDCGVFVGVGAGDYNHRFLGANAATAHVFSGNQASILAARIAYLLDLHGPALAVDTACSSSLVALHLACESIRSGESAMAVAGGVFISVTAQFHVLSSQMGMLSPHGRCAAFAHDADGFVPGEGVGAVVLKPLDEAQAAGDQILGVIRATGMNQDGATNGITAPSADSQARLEAAVYHKAGINPADIGLIESHGTGTALGDPIEVEALTRAFAEADAAPGSVALGSVKTNIGHAATAAGIAGLTKVLLAMRHRRIPPSRHYNQANPHIHFNETPFYVPTQTRDWPVPAGGVRLAAVSSFGFSGTNCHVVVAEAPAPAERRPDAVSTREFYLLSALDDTDLTQRAKLLADYLDRHPNLYAADLAFTLAARRAHFDKRLCLEAADLTTLAAALRAFVAGNQPREQLSAATASSRGLTRLHTWLSGEVVDWNAAFADRDVRLVTPPTYPLRRTRYWVPAPEEAAPAPAPQVEPAAQVAAFPSPPAMLTPDLFYLRDHQVRGQAVLPGVTVLEFAGGAADRGEAVSGFRDVTWLSPLAVAQPRRLRVDLDGDSFAVHSDQGGPHARGRLHFGAVDAAPVMPAYDAAVASLGSGISGAELYPKLAAAGFGYGPAMQPIQTLHRSEDHAVARLHLPASAGDPGAFRLHPSLLDGALQTVVGLSGTAQPLLPFHVERVDLHGPLQARMVAHAVRIDNHTYNVTLTDPSGRVALHFAGIQARPLPAPEQERDEAEDAPCFFVPDLRALEPSTVAASSEGPVLIVYRQGTPPLHRALADRHDGLPVFLIKIGRRNRPLSEHEWEVASGDAEALAEVLDTLGAVRLVYFLAALQWNEPADDLSHLEDHENRGVIMLFHLVQLLGRRDPAQSLVVKAVTDQVLNGDPEVHVRPLSAALPGFCRSVAREFHHLHFACVDVNLNDATPNSRKLLEQVAAQLAAEPADREGRLTVLRGEARFGRLLVPAQLPKVDVSPFRRGGTYLILGGHGGIGMVLARRLARDFAANVVLIGRRAHEAGPAERVAELEALGGTAVYFQADAAEPGALARVVRQVHERFGPIHGAVHSAIALRDRLLEHMDPDTFRAALFPKTRATHNFCNALQDEPLDFMLVFSSLQSFLGGAGQSNYAAGCTFQDAWIRAHHSRAAYPVKLLHWGFWGSVGVVAQEKYRTRMAELGLHSIEPQFGLATLERFLVSEWSELLVVRADRDLMDQIGVDWDSRAVALKAETDSLLAGELGAERGGRLPAAVEQQVRGLDEVNQWCALQAAWLLQSLFPQLQPGVEFDLDELTAARPRFRRLIEALTAMAVEAGHLSRPGRRYQLDHAAVAAEANADALMEQHPESAAYVRLVRACTAQMKAVVAGDKAAAEVLFPGGSDALVAAVYRGNQIADYYNDLLADLVHDLCAARAQQSGVRVLEVGAGTGGTTTAVVGRLAELAPDYCFTDVSPALVARARNTLGKDRPWMDFAVMDLEAAPPQSWEPGSFDLIIAGNVLHAVRDVGAVLRRLQSLLKPNGCLVLNELTAPHHFATLSFGLLDSWWASQDTGRRLPHGPLLDEDGWRLLLRESGFRRVRLMGPGGKRGRRQRIITAESNGVALLPATITAAPVAAAPTPRDAPKPTASSSGAAEAVRLRIRAVMAEVLELDPEAMDVDTPHERFGVDSILAVDLVDRINAEEAVDLRATDFFNFACIRDLADHILTLKPQAEASSSPPAQAEALDETELLDLFRRLEAGEIDVDEVDRQLARRAHEG